MQVFNINTILLGTITVIVSAVAVPLLDQPAVADQSDAVTIVPQQPPIVDSHQLPQRPAISKVLKSVLEPGAGANRRSRAFGEPKAGDADDAWINIELPRAVSTRP